MSITTISNRYAHALADVIIERNEVGESLAELNGFVSLIADNRELYDVFASPVIALDRKKAVLGELLTRLAPRQTLRNFLSLLVENGRLQNLPEIQKSLIRALDERGGIVSAEIITARPLGDANRDLLSAKLREATGKEVRLQFRTDPDIIGGVITRIGSLVFDGSIKDQLARMKQQLAKA
ncbi:MAG: ATP synthase F1 subunit delta [Blastocatellia bacterium]